MAKLNDNLKRELLKMDPDKFDIDFMIENFGYRSKIVNGKMEVIEPKFYTAHTVHLEPNEYINKTAVDTNCGIILFNKLLVEGELENIIPNGFHNATLDKKGLNKFMAIVSDALRAGKISVNPTYVTFLKKYEWYGLTCASLFSPSYTLNIIKPNKKVQEEKEKMLEKVGDLEDVTKMVEMENSFVEMAKGELKDDAAYSLYASGARGSFDNDYKNISLALGPVKNVVTGEYKYVKHNYIDGMEREDLVSMGNALVDAEFPKAIGTQESGYETKKFYAMFQDILLDDDPTSNCGTKETLDVLITKENKQYYLYQYIIVNGRPFRLDDDNIDKFVGKSVKLRSYMLCTNPKCCNVCSGTRYHDMGIGAAGITAVKISNGLLNKRMKLRHSSKIELYEVQTKNLLLESFIGANYFTTDEDNVYLNTLCAEAYIPESLFQDKTEESENMIYRKDGSSFKCIGVFNMRFYQNEDFNREKTPIYTLGFPTIIYTSPTSYSVENIIINGIEDRYRVFYYEKGDIMMKKKDKKDPLNCEVYIKLLLSGKIPNSIDYKKTISLWNLSFDINGYDPGVPDIIKQMIIGKLYRNKDDYTQEFRIVAGTGKVGMTDYITMNPREITSNSSVLAGLAFEDFGSALNSALLMSKRDTLQAKSPIEEILFN